MLRSFFALIPNNNKTTVRGVILTQKSFNELTSNL